MSCSGRSSTISKRKMADCENDDRAVRPLPVFNGTMTGPSKRATKAILAPYGVRALSSTCARSAYSPSLRATTMTKIPTTTRFRFPSSDVRRAAHIMTSALGTDPFLFFQGVNNDPAAILRILDTKYQGTDTTSIMSVVNEFTTKKYRPGQHIEMFVAVYEGLAMRLETIGQVSRNRCALSISSTHCLRSRPYLQFCRRFVS
jgi:hypothetical protein